MCFCLQPVLFMIKNKIKISEVRFMSSLIRELQENELKDFARLSIDVFSANGSLQVTQINLISSSNCSDKVFASSKLVFFNANSIFVSNSVFFCSISK